MVYVLTQLEGILVDAEYYGLPFILHPWEGGYTLYGAVLGAALGIWLYGRVIRRSPGKRGGCGGNPERRWPCA